MTEQMAEATKVLAANQGLTMASSPPGSPGR